VHEQEVLWFGEQSSFIFGWGGGMLEDIECLFCETEGIDITTDGWDVNTAFSRSTIFQGSGEDNR
jgi:hypothetical protein